MTDITPQQEYKFAMQHWENTEHGVVKAREAYERAIVLREQARVRTEAALKSLEKQ